MTTETREMQAAPETEVAPEASATPTPEAPELGSASADYTRLATEQLDSAYRLAGYLLGDGAAAQDAVHTALIRAWQFWPELGDTARFPAWFERIVVEVCLGRMRRRPAAGSAETSASADVFRSMADDDEIARAVSALPPEHRTVIVLRYWQGLALDGVADRLGISTAAAESRLYEALKALGRQLEASDR